MCDGSKAARSGASSSSPTRRGWRRPWCDCTRTRRSRNIRQTPKSSGRNEAAHKQSSPRKEGLILKVVARAGFEPVMRTIQQPCSPAPSCPENRLLSASHLDGAIERASPKTPIKTDRRRLPRKNLRPIQATDLASFDHWVGMGLFRSRCFASQCCIDDLLQLPELAAQRFGDGF